MAKTTIKTVNAKIKEMGLAWGLEVVRDNARNLYWSGLITELAYSRELCEWDADRLDWDREIREAVSDSEMNGYLRKQMEAGLRDLAECVFETSDTSQFEWGIDGEIGWMNATSKCEKFAGSSLEYRWSSKQSKWSNGPEGWTMVED
jgi:hypothetical protein